MNKKKNKPRIFYCRQFRRYNTIVWANIVVFPIVTFLGRIRWWNKTLYIKFSNRHWFIFIRWLWRIQRYIDARRKSLSKKKSIFPFSTFFFIQKKQESSSSGQIHARVKRKRSNDDPEYRKAKINFMQVATKYMETMNEDENDVLAKRWAMQLRQMNPEQKLFAEKLINDVLYEGLMNKLNYNRRLTDFMYKHLWKFGNFSHFFGTVLLKFSVYV